MKAIAWGKWSGILLLKALAWPYSFIAYPMAYIFRESVRRNKKLLSFLWIVLDDENDYGEPWYHAKHGFKENFGRAWVWSWARNNSWNLNQLLICRVHPEGLIYGYNTAGGSPLDHNRFKWELHIADNIWLDGWDVNQGDRLSQKYTRIGKAWAWYEKGTGVYKAKRKPMYFRGSYAGFVLGLMVNYKIGFNKRGEALLDLKLKRNKKKYTEHWKGIRKYRNFFSKNK